MTLGVIGLYFGVISAPEEQTVVVCETIANPLDERSDVSPEQWLESLGTTEPDAGIYVAHKTYLTRQIREITQVQSPPTADNQPLPPPTRC
jgi:hypothetical protein